MDELTYFDLHNQGPIVYTETILGLAQQLINGGLAPDHALRRINDHILELEACGLLPAYAGQWRASRLHGVCASIGIFCNAKKRKSAILSDIKRYRRAAKLGGTIAVASSWQSVARAMSEKKKAVLFQVENLDFVETCDELDVLLENGVRIFGLAYNHGNRLADGCMTANDTGITNFGRKAINWANKNKVCLDLSHASPRSTLDAIHRADLPICTHTFLRRVHGHARGKSAEALKLLAEKGGIVGVPIHPMLIGPTTKQFDVLQKFAEHVAALCELIGSNHVGIGSDWAGTLPKKIASLFSATELAANNADLQANKAIPGYKGITHWSNLVEALKKIGLSYTDICNVSGQSFIKWLALISVSDNAR